MWRWTMKMLKMRAMTNNRLFSAPYLQYSCYYTVKNAAQKVAMHHILRQTVLGASGELRYF